MADEDLQGQSGGMLSQDALDALFAAAGAEGEAADDQWTVDAEAGLADTSLDAQMGAIGMGAMGMGMAGPLDLPSFDPPAPAAAPLGGGTAAEPAGMTRVRDIPLDVTVELGRTKLLIRDILDLGAGSIIELDKIAGEPVDLFANGLLIARGEVIVIDDNFGVRITEVITAAARAQTKEANALAA